MDFDKELIAIYPWILKIARKYCYTIEEAEDLAGETVCKMLSNKNRFENGCPLKPWCKVIMLNTYITNYNRNSLVRFVGYEHVLDFTSSRNISDRLAFRELVSAIRRCAAKSCSIECVIYHAKGYSYDEISKILRIPITTVRSRISWGRKILGEEIGY